MRNYSTLQTALEKRRLELQDRLEKLRRDISQGHTSDWPDQSQERENDEVLNQLGIKAEQEINDIKAAFSRIKQGHYGVCLECGKHIPIKRLTIKPDAKFCTYCAYKM